ncbi:MAG: hypothetical protein HPY59_04070 [Anaerolineae bacterium]|nr:hypothetical protein [Anaerolineae bacterium]
MKSQTRFLKPVLIFLGAMTFVLTLLLVSSETPLAAGKSLSPEQDAPPSNAECLLCHEKTDQVLSFSNGDTVSITIRPGDYGKSAHGLELMTCVSCHSDITGYPHPEVAAKDSRKAYSASYLGICRDCHGEQASQLNDSIHGEALATGNENAPLCTDCHNPHSQQPVRDEKGGLTLSGRHEIPQTCARCHSQIFDQYAQSVHGMGIVVENNPDAPTCTDCHGVHQIVDPTTARFRLQSPEMCSDCHTNETVMAKYGLSTNVLNTYVSDFHGTTVTLFEKTSPDQPTNKAVCYDCHGVHDIRRTDDPEKGLQVKENLLQTCKRCHPDATANFPDSWMSHYIPNPERYPVVYYVNLFYKFFIPTVLGGMAVFVVSDFSRRMLERRKKPVEKTPAVEGKGSASQESSEEGSTGAVGESSPQEARDE